MKMSEREIQPMKQRKPTTKHNSKWKVIESSTHANEREEQ